MSEEFPKRSRFRLVDAVATLLVLGVLIGLFLPSVSRPRKPPRLLICSNNLKQLTIAVQEFYAAKERFPGYAETIFPNTDNASSARDYSWVVALAPYLDQKTLWDEWSNPQVKSPPRPCISFLWCPSNGSPDTSRPALSYVANVGLLDSEENRPANGVFLNRCVRHTDGKLAQPSAVTFDSVVDGFSYTMLLSERLDAGEWPELDKTKIGCGWWKTTTPTLEMHINGKRPQPGSAVPLASPSSRHPGGVMAAFCDGSTRFLSQDIDYRVYIQLLTPDDQQSDMPDEWKRIKLSNSDFP